MSAWPLESLRELALPHPEPALKEERGMAGCSMCRSEIHGRACPRLLVVQSRRLPSSKRHCPSLLNNLFSPFSPPPPPAALRDPLGLRRCVTTSDDNFLGDQVRNPASRPAVNHPAGAPTYIGSRSQGMGRGRGRGNNRISRA